MVDFLTPAGRSDRMRRIRSANTSPEVTVRKALHRLGFRFRLQGKGLPGRPDIVLPKYRAVVLVHGCFWHRHAGCKVASNPKSNTEFWKEKFDRNMARDAKVANELEEKGWRVLVVWECELGSAARLETAILKLANEIKGPESVDRHKDGLSPSAAPG